ncbi:MAG: hypothetical protein J0I69_09490 [Altererythrobacter sp.]|nr:hypothetical protein [Altererythrobacter sp.]OJU58681.1 MAG: hypothetical protein BGO08_06590 [Altererythrobacter sp. 66-12]
MDKNTTSRRSFLKAGAIAATPLVAAAPVAALADDGSRARLARLEDERAIEALHRAFLRNADGARDRFALGEGLRSIAGEPATDTTITFAEDGRTATARQECRVERQTEFTGHSTLEQMARFQGQGSHVQEERRVLATQLVRDKQGWRIAQARLA